MTHTANWQHWAKVLKLRVVLLMILTAWAGMVLTKVHYTLWQACSALGGIGLIACAGGGCNQLFEKKIDKHMTRTQQRPLVKGIISPQQLQLVIIAMCLTGTVILLTQTNALTWVLTCLTMFGYSIIYTLFLKPRTPQNIVIGGLFGAFPPALGWCAVTGELSAAPLLLVLIVFSWTPPHFWSLALAKKKDYAHAGLPMFPLVYGDQMTRLHIWLYTVQLIAASQLPYLIGLGHWPYLLGVNLLNIRFGWLAWTLWRQPKSIDPMRLFYDSMSYLGLLFLCLTLDHLYY